MNTLTKVHEMQKPKQLQDFSKLSFYCNKKQKPACCFTHLVGLPKHPFTYTPMGLMPYQSQFFKTIEHSRYHKFHINKSRQMGMTELILRILQYRAFTKYKGGKIIIIAGTREKTTKKLFQRLRELFRAIPSVIEKSDDLTIKLFNGTTFEGLPARAEAILGDTKIKAIFMDEASKWLLVDDDPVMNAVKPIVEINKSDLFLISTPNGPKGFFYKIERDTNDFMKIKYDIYQAVGFLYTMEKAEEMLKDNTVDTDQEYLNQYTTGRNSIFGTVLPEEIGDFETLE